MKIQVEAGPQFDIKQLYQNLQNNGSLTSKAGLPMKAGDLLNNKNRSASNRSAKEVMNKVTPRQDTNILTKEYLRLQIREKEQQLSIKPINQKLSGLQKGFVSKNVPQNLSSTELSNAMQKYHQYLQQTQTKNRQNKLEPAQKSTSQLDSLPQQYNQLTTSKSSGTLLNQFVTKVSQDDMGQNRLNFQSGTQLKKRGLGDLEKQISFSKPATPVPSPTQKSPTSTLDFKFFSSSRPATSDKNLSSRLQVCNYWIQFKNQQLMTQSAIQSQKNFSQTKQQRSIESGLIKKQPVSQSALFSKSPALKWAKNEKQIQNVQQVPNVQGYYLHAMQNAFKKPISEDYFCRLYRDHFYQTYQGVYFAQFLKSADPNDLKNKRVFLKKADMHKNKITIVFDLDETLVHCNENTSIKSDITLQIQVSKNELISAGINIRPGAIELLKELSKHFEIIVFTASHSCYAQKVLDYLDPMNTLIKHRLFRESCCMTTGGMYTKDLRIFADRSLDQLVLVDNAAYSYAWQVDNGVPIIPYYEDKADRELDTLREYLKGMIGVKDVREYNRQHLRLQYFNEAFGPQKAFESVFGYRLDQ